MDSWVQETNTLSTLFRYFLNESIQYLTSFSKFLISVKSLQGEGLTYGRRILAGIEESISGTYK